MSKPTGVEEILKADERINRFNNMLDETLTLENLVKTSKNHSFKSEFPIKLKDLVLKRDSNWTNLSMLAVVNGELEVAKLCIEQGVKANVSKSEFLINLKDAVLKGDFNWTNLMTLAVVNGELEAAELCIEQGVNVDARDATGQNILTSAVRTNNADAVKLLLKHQANINGTNLKIETRPNQWSNLSTPLMVALDSNLLEMAKLLIDEGANIYAKNQKDDTALFVASAKGFYEIVKLLIEKGADADAKNLDGETPLMKASKEGRLSVVKLLIEHGVNPNAQDNLKKTALEHSAHKAQILVFNTSSGKVFRSESLTEFNDSESLKVMIFLIENGANVFTSGDIFGVGVFGERKLNKMQKDENLTKQAENIKKLVEVLRDSGIENDPHSIISDNRNKFQEAVNRGDAEFVRSSIKDHPKFSKYADECARTVLMNASKYGYLEIVKILIEGDAEVSLKDKNGHTARELAIQSGYEEIAKFLEKEEIAVKKRKFKESQFLSGDDSQSKKIKKEPCASNVAVSGVNAVSLSNNSLSH